MRNEHPNGNGVNGNGVATLNFHVSDATGVRAIEVSDIQPSTSTGEVAAALAARLDLPTNVPWGLRSSRTSRVLDDNEPIGEQIAQEGERVSVMPKAHLG